MEKELMKDSTRMNLLNDINQNIPLFTEYLWNVDKNKAEYDIVLIFTVAYLDFLVCLKNLLSNNELFWENAVAFKNIYKIIEESHNKIFGKVIYSKGSLDLKNTQKFKKCSLWFGTISAFITDENESDFNRISGLLETFNAKNDLEYIRKIRNFDGHYSNLDDYMSEIKSIDMDTTVRIACDWFVIMRDVHLFVKNKLGVSK